MLTNNMSPRGLALVGGLPVAVVAQRGSVKTQRIATTGGEQVIAVIIITIARLVVSNPSPIVVIDGFGGHIESMLLELIDDGLNVLQ